MADQNTSPFSILLVDDEPGILRGLSMMLTAAGFRDVTTLEDSRQAIATIESKHVDMVILDLQMPHVSGLEILVESRRRFPEIPVLILTANNELERAVECMRLGAYDYHVKPVDPEKLLTSIRRSREATEMRNELALIHREFLKADTGTEDSPFAAFVTVNERMRNILRYAKVLSLTSEPLLVCGAIGTGKDLLASTIHSASGKKGSFVRVNTAGMDDQTFANTLFGSIGGNGSFSPGEIARAKEGTLYLDEIGGLSDATQVRILQLIENRSYLPLGGQSPEHSSARLILSTTPDIDEKVRKGSFRKDLFYRLQSRRIDLPPLKERTEDIPFLLNYLIGKSAIRLGRPRPSFAPDLVVTLMEYPFPGNVRELESLIDYVLLQGEQSLLTEDSFAKAPGISEMIASRREEKKAAQQKGGRRSYDTIVRLFGHFPTLEEAEDYLIQEAMKLTDGNQKSAASLLDITRQTISRRMKKLKSPEDETNG